MPDMTKEDARQTCVFEVGKEYKTRDGGQARIYAIDGGYNGPIHGAIYEDEIGWCIHEWLPDGRDGGDRTEHPDDLIPPKRTVEVVWCEGPEGELHVFEDTPGRHYLWRVIARRTLTEGEGL